ncbi:MAG: hypothetical protein JHC93_04030 [Parachlamydiales bacterium]|nr:hypothetical protein [Parachlamydiales bacterium]
MKLVKYLLSVLSLVAVSTVAAQSYTLVDSDEPVVKQVEKNKSVISIKNKGGNLFISGDVRAKWIKEYRKTNGVDYFGQNGVPADSYEAKTSLLFNYDADNSWAQTKLEFKANPLGVNGSPGTLKLRRAFIGYDILDQGNNELYVEVGRQKMDYLFESSIQFDSIYDGILIGYEYSWKNTGDFFVHAGPFIVNSTSENYGYVGETGLMQMFQTGLYTKLSFINWKNNKADASGTRYSPNLRYQNTQLVIGYVFEPQTFGAPVRLFSGMVYNGAAKRTQTSDYHKANKGYYAGVEFGKLEVAGDYSVTVSYQYVGFYAVPEYDVSGIGAGFCQGPAYQQDPLNPANTGGVNPDFLNPATVEGQTNYKGFSLTALYNITSNLALNLDGCYSTRILTEIGGHNDYRKMELGLIYSY